MLATTLSRSALRGLHHAVGDAAGEVVLEERPALAHHVPVALPADQAGDAGDHRVVAHQAVEQQRPGRTDQHRSAMPSSIGVCAAAPRAVGAAISRPGGR
jgi:hypothetical protein